MDKGTYDLAASLYSENDGDVNFVLDIASDVDTSMEHLDLDYDLATEVAKVRFTVPTNGKYKLVLRRSSQSQTKLLCREAAIARVEADDEPINILAVQTDTRPIDHLDYVIFGNTNFCNSSCLHCPVNKTWFLRPPRGVMSLPLFERIVRDLADSNLPIRNIHFGMQNETFTDPFLDERIKIIKTFLPDSHLALNTNAALFSEEKHRWAIQHADAVLIQASGFSVAVYEKLMAPLKRDSSFAKIMQILRMAKRVDIEVPVSQNNLAEAAQIRDFWLKTGATAVYFAALSNRCGDLRGFEQMSVAPSPGICRSGIASNLIVDWDGKVLNCCQDFSRREILGDLSVQSLREVLDSPELRKFMLDLDAGLWGLHNCRYCKYDNFNAVQQLCAAKGA